MNPQQQKYRSVIYSFLIRGFSDVFVTIFLKLAITLGVFYLSVHFASTFQTVFFLPAIVHLVVVYLLLDVVFTIGIQSISFVYRRKVKQHDERADGFIVGITRLAGALFYIMFAFFVVDVFVPIQTLFGSITIAIAIIGLAFRDAVTNFVSGINIMFSGKFQFGEYVRIGQVKGRIRDLTFTHVHLQTESQDLVFVPNNLVLAQEVTNYSKTRSKNVYVHMVVDRSQYEHYRELQERILQRIQRSFENELVGKESVRIRVESLDKESTSWIIEYHVSRYDFGLEIALKNVTAEIVVDFFAEKEAQNK